MNYFTNITDFTPDKFTPTKWEGEDKKAAFARHFIKFLQWDFSRKQFTKAFYQRLSATFGHIAHFNVGGFYEEFFSTTEGKVRFLRQTLAHPCYGDPAWTHSDVERALQQWVRHNGALEKYERLLAEETEAEERSTLARLQMKYGKEGTP
jgi:hypothetical protein